MIRNRRLLLPIAAVLLLQGASVSAREACQERTLGLRYAPQENPSWCWAASGQMVMEWLGQSSLHACQCRQAEIMLGATGCCRSTRTCERAANAPPACDEALWPAFVDGPASYRLDYKTTCDDLPARQDDEACDARPLGWLQLAAEICAGRPVLATLHDPASPRGHAVVVKGFSTHPGPRVLVVDPLRLCPPGRDCEGELDEGFWLTYDEFAAGWDGRRHWVDFYGIQSQRRVRATALARERRER